jgi:hypothetical protein
MVFKGLNQDLTRELGKSRDTSLMSLSVSVGLTLCIFVGFLMAERLGTTMARRGTYLGAWGCIALFCMWAVGTSSWYAYMSTTGTPALGMHLMDAAAKLDRAVAGATAQIKNARGVPTAMSAKAAGFSTRGASEASGGGASGARGAGPVSQSLEGAAAVLTSGAEGISAAVEKADREAALMREKVREISVAVSDRSIPVFERERIYLKGASEVRSMISAMNDAGLGEIVGSSLAAVKSAVSVMPTESSKVGARQAEAIGQTREDMQKIAGDLEAVLGELKSAEAVSGSLVETVSLSEVVWNYKSRFIPALVLAIGIDLFAAWALIFLGLHGLDEVKKREARRSVFRGWLELDEVVGKAVLDGEVLKSLNFPGDAPAEGSPAAEQASMKKKRARV